MQSSKKKLIDFNTYIYWYITVYYSNGPEITELMKHRKLYSYKNS